MMFPRIIRYCRVEYRLIATESGTIQRVLFFSTSMCGSCWYMIPDLVTCIVDNDSLRR